LNPEADNTVDFRGAIASITLLEMTDTFREMKADQILKILVLDPETISDIFKVLPASSYELLEMEDKTEGYMIRLKKLHDNR
jgi:TusA-related sulfurtransferase